MSDPIEFLEKLLKVARRSDDVEFLVELLFDLKREEVSDDI